MVSYIDPGAACLEITDICHNYGQKAVLQHVSLAARKSEVVALLGPSGSGKSTLLAVTAGIVKPRQGKILLHGRNLLDLPPEARGLGMVFQDYALWPHMTVAQNVAFPLRARGIVATEIATRTQTALTRVGLDDFAARRPHQLSGGQQQRVALARAVVAEPQLLLLDEPLSALDPATRTSVRGELAGLLRKLGLTTIIVTHEREEAFELADRVAVLVDGEIQQHASPEDVYERPANLAVARFMGVNLLSVRTDGSAGAELRGNPGCRLELPCALPNGTAELVIVPEQCHVVENHPERTNVFLAELLRSQYRGGEYRSHVRIGNPQIGQVIEARSKDSPRGERLLVHLPAKSLHIVRSSPQAAPQTAVEPREAHRTLDQLQEEIA
jgi:iron(III) transport system ATP-binding protein